MRLTDIAVRVEDGAPIAAATERNGGLGGGVTAILAEIAAGLERLTIAGNTALIDLRSLPLSPDDREELRLALGHGEVTATLEAQGISTLRETAVAGVWWTEHRDQEGALTAELLDIALTPPILAAHPSDVVMAAAALRRRLGTTSPSGSPVKGAA